LLLSFFYFISGIMFPIRAKAVLPVQHIVLKSIAVRGQLGSLTVWITNEDEQVDAQGRFQTRLTPRHWTQIYAQKHAPSQSRYQTLEFAQPVLLYPGQVRGIYIHSTRGGDDAIVYDDSDPRIAPHVPRYQDPFLSIHSGKAHLSPTAFGQMPIWGWGNAWRDRREFVGQIQYGAVYQLWNPQIHQQFGPSFRDATTSLLALQRRDGCVMSSLPDECIYYILNMCRWDWFSDSAEAIKHEKRQRKRQAAAAEDASMDDDNDDEGPSLEEAHAMVAQLREYQRQQEENDEVEEGEDEDYEEEGEDEEMDEDEDDDDEDESSDDDHDDASNESDWERINGYRADTTAFTYQYYSSDEEGEEPAIRGPYFRGNIGAALVVHRYDRRSIVQHIQRIVQNIHDEED
jgi:hypothetical protein